MFKNYFFILLCLLMLPLSGVAAGGDGEVPIRFISFQALNFFIFLGIVIYLIAKKTPSILHKKYQDYMLMNQQAQDLYQVAKNENQKLKKQIQDVQLRFQTLQAELNKETQKMKQDLRLQTQETCDSILRSANHFIEKESVKIKELLKRDLLKQVAVLCKSECEKKHISAEPFIRKLNHSVRSFL